MCTSSAAAAAAGSATGAAAAAFFGAGAAAFLATFLGAGATSSSISSSDFSTYEIFLVARDERRSAIVFVKLAGWFTPMKKRAGRDAGDSSDSDVEGLTPWDLARDVRPVVCMLFCFVIASVMLGSPGLLLAQVTDDRTLRVDVRSLNVELACPVCLGILRKTVTVMEARVCVACCPACCA